MTDLRKPSLDLLYELIEQANPGFTAKFPQGTISFGTPTSSSAGGGFTNTRIAFRSKSGGTTIGSGYLYYRRIELNRLFRGISPRIDEYRPGMTMTMREMVGLINARYGLSVEPDNITNAGGTVTAEQSFGLEATTARQLCYIGSAGFTWYRGKRPLDDLVTVDKRTLDGRAFPTSITSYAQFLTQLTTSYGTNNQDTSKALAASSTNPIGGSYYCVDTTLPVIGDPVGDFVRYDSGMSGVVRMLMGDPAVAEESFANRRRIGMVYEGSTARQGFAAVSRNGVTSQAAGAGTGNAIRSMFWWDEINRRAMLWQNPKTAGTKATSYKARRPTADERPRGDLIGYNGDYSKWASKLSGTISWQEVADAMKEVTGLPFSMDDYSVPFGLGNIPGGNFPRYTLPTASVPEANTAKFNRVVLVTAPDLGAWWTGRFFLHYNA